MIAIKQPARGLHLAALLDRADFEPREALPLLTVVLLLTAAPDQWYLRGPLIGVLALGVVYRRWLAAPQFWYVITTLLATTIYLNWESSDNHKYLLAYWCLALCTALSLPVGQQAAARALSSRWLIGLSMLLAASWKLAMRDYCDGSFFEFTLLADERFAHFTNTIADVPLKTLADNRILQDLLREGHLRGEEASSVVFGSLPAVGWLAQAMTWWTVAIEAVLAVSFLAPDRRGTALARNALLLIFATTTYAIAPVRGFGWTLMLLGLAQCEDRERQFRPLYLATILLIQAYTLPMAAVFERLLGN